MPEPMQSRFQVAVLLTRRCNISCAHCSVASSPSIPDRPDDSELRRIVDEIIDAGVRVIQFTGGEPMLRENLLLDLLRRASARGVVGSVTSNGSWGDSLSAAREKLRQLRKAGMQQLTISYDPFHEEFLPIERVLHIARAAEEADFTIQVNITRMKDDSFLSGIVGKLESVRSVELRFYDVQKVGRALAFDADAFRGNLEGFCNACDRAAIADDGRLLACNGPSYFSKRDSPLVVGHVAEEGIASLLDRHAEDPILEAIRVQGPLYLREVVERETGSAASLDPGTFTGLCDLCVHLNSDPVIVETLRQALSRPEEVARRASRRQLIEKKRQSREFNRRFVNHEGIARVVLNASIPGVLPASERMDSNLLRRQDLDWNELSRVVRGNGLARSLSDFIESGQVREVAPEFFVSEMQESARRESLKQVAVQKVLRRIGRVLEEKGVEGVLLKGGALMLDTLSRGEPIVSKAPGDIDLYIGGGHAEDVWTALQEIGFSRGETPGSEVHLRPLFSGGVVVEIHTAIMEKAWDLPEDEMIAGSLPVPGWKPFRILSPEAMLLHVAMHLTREGYTHGLKSFWSFLYLAGMRTAGGWEDAVLKRWVSNLSHPRAFWVPVEIAMLDLGIPFPETWKKEFPGDRRQAVLLRYARARIYTILDYERAALILHRLPHDLLLAGNWRGVAGVILRQGLSPAGMKRRWEYARRIGMRKYIGSKWRLLKRVFAPR